MCPLRGQTENKLTLKTMCFPFNFQFNNEFISFFGQSNKETYDIFWRNRQNWNCILAWPL